MKINKLHMPFMALAAVLIVLVFNSCKDYYQPKPRGYFRIEFPEKKYLTSSGNLPYSFDYPVYANLEKDNHPFAEKYWTNLVFPDFQAKVHLSYKAVNGNLAALLEDAHKMVNKHIPKANAINEQVFINKTEKVYGIAYSIHGVDAASVYQFYLTDSTNHFIRAALYFNVAPNNDSLSPVIAFIKTDLQYLIETFKWQSLSD
jgi:gliding motility-associated lipoprotein GldD